jgi:hypothetical protein
MTTFDTILVVAVIGLLVMLWRDMRVMAEMDEVMWEEE